MSNRSSIGHPFEMILINGSSHNVSHGRLILPKSNDVPLPFTLAYTILACLVIISNGLVITIFLKNRDIRKRKSHLFLLSLSCADFLVGFCSLVYIFSIKSIRLDTISRGISTIVLGFSLETSMFSLCCLTYERLVGIRDSLKYHNLVTSKTVNGAILLTWFVAGLLTCAQGIIAFKIEDGKYLELNGVVIVGFALITSVFLALVYCYLYKEIRRHCKDIRSKSVSASNSIDLEMIPTIKSLESTLEIANSELDALNKATIKAKKSKRQKSISKEKRSLIFCSFIVCSFVICWTPITIFIAGVLSGVDHMRTDLVLYISTFLVLINSLLDPIIYFALRKDMRMAAAAVICRRNNLT